MADCWCGRVVWVTNLRFLCMKPPPSIDPGFSGAIGEICSGNSFCSVFLGSVRAWLIFDTNCIKVCFKPLVWSIISTLLMFIALQKINLVRLIMGLYTQSSRFGKYPKAHLWPNDMERGIIVWVTKSIKLFPLFLRGDEGELDKTTNSPLPAGRQANPLLQKEGTLNPRTNFIS